MRQSDNLPAAGDRQVTLWQLALIFLKIGAIGFGGGMAVIALMQTECIKQRRWLAADDFLHGVGLGQILGPFAVNTATFIGYRLFGLLGGMVASLSFLFPSITLVIILSWLYEAFHHVPSLQNALIGLGPVVMALILSAAWFMGHKKLKSATGIVIVLATLLAGVLHFNPLWPLVAAGLVGLGLKLGGEDNRPPAPAPTTQSILVLLPTAFPAPAGMAAASAAPPATGTAVGLVGLTGLFYLGWVFLKVGLVFFGGGFVLIPVLHHHLVKVLGWLTPQQFLDGVAISQLTPGPIAVLATFAGYLKAGVPGALVATATLFAPAMVLMLILSASYERLRDKSFARHFLAGVEPAVIGLILASAVVLAPSSLSLARPLSLGLGLLALVLLVRFQWHPALVLLIGAVAGMLAPGLL